VNALELVGIEAPGLQERQSEEEGDGDEENHRQDDELRAEARAHEETMETASISADEL
jgi:hypothetical protein